MVAAFSESRTTFAAKSQMPKRAAAIPLAPLSVDGRTDGLGAADVAAPVVTVLGGVGLDDAGFDDVNPAPVAEGTVTAIASICAFNAPALIPFVSLGLVNDDNVARRLFLALTRSSSPRSSEIFACSSTFCSGGAVASRASSESSSFWTSVPLAANLFCSWLSDRDDAEAPWVSLGPG